MNGGALPYVLMFAAAGLALSLLTAPAAWRSLCVLWVSALLVAMFAPVNVPGGVLLAGFWLSMMAAAAAVLLGRGVPQPVAIGAAINNGAWSGALAATSDMRGAMTFALPISLLFVAGRWFNRRGHGIALKVLSSWLIAVGALALFVSLVPTPGYELDHME